MRSVSCIAGILIAFPLVAADDGFVPLFNGKDETGWTFALRPPKDKPEEKPDPKKTWTVEDGILKCTGKPNGYIATEKEYGNYELKLQWRYPKGSTGGNGGILFHVQKDDRVWPHCIEAQLASNKAGDVWLHADEKKVLPSIEIDPKRKDEANKEGRHYFRVDRDKPIEKEIGEWNECEIGCKDGDIKIAVNGKPANDAVNCSLKKGRIALQSEGSPIEFREIRLRVAKSR